MNQSSHHRLYLVLVTTLLPRVLEEAAPTTGLSSSARKGGIRATVPHI